MSDENKINITSKEIIEYIIAGAIIGVIIVIMGLYVGLITF